MKKITAYKVNNLSKVDLRFYKEGDHFITPRSVGMLANGKMKTLQDRSDLMTELNDLKNRVKALEESRGRNLQRDITEGYTESINKIIPVVDGRSLRIEFSINSGTSSYVFIRNTEPLHEGQEYTLSFYATLYSD